jgi:hypothetical protein
MIPIDIMRALAIGRHAASYAIEGKEIEVRVFVRPALTEAQKMEVLEGSVHEYIHGDPHRAFECYARSHCRRDATVVVVDDIRDTTMRVCPHHARTMYLDLPAVPLPREHIEIGLARRRAQQPPAMEVETEGDDQ